MKRFLFFTFLVLLVVPNLIAENFRLKIFQPNLLHLQYAGNVGLGGIGLGYYSPNTMHYFGIGYGFLPKQVHGAEVETFFIKYAHRITKKKIDSKHAITSYVGSNLNYARANNTYLDYPGYFPQSYYDVPNALHLAPFLGIKLEKSNLVNFHWEIGTLEYKLWYAITSKAVSLTRIWNFAFGVSFKLR